MTMISGDEMDRIFRESLAGLADDVPGCRALDTDSWGAAAPLARLCFAGGGYYVHAHLGHDAGMRPERWATRVSALWASEQGERRYALDVAMSGPGARDGRLLAALVLAAVLIDREDHPAGK
jgi:hypothetical protein